jgi:hypothetical protein
MMRIDEPVPAAKLPIGATAAHASANAAKPRTTLPLNVETALLVMLFPFAVAGEMAVTQMRKPVCETAGCTRVAWLCHRNGRAIAINPAIPTT